MNGMEGNGMYKYAQLGIKAKMGTANGYEWYFAVFKLPHNNTPIGNSSRFFAGITAIVK